jgi:hypothetical protein
MLVTPCLQVRSKTAVCYNKFERSGIRSLKQLHSDKQLKKRATYTGVLCPGAKKRLTTAIELIVQAATKDKPFQFISKKTGKAVQATFKLNFITLTIHSPGKMIRGKEGHSLCLEPLLLYLRRYYGLNLYVWKAELQKRGQLHYHITSDCYVPWDALRNKWNQLQVSAGYLDQYKVDTGHYDANSTDVHSVYKVKDMAKYLKKSIIRTYKKADGGLISEFQKDVQNTACIGGKVWDCSLNLKGPGFYTIDCGGSIYNEVMKPIILEAKKTGSIVYTDKCTIYGFTRPVSFLLNDFFREDYEDYLQKIVNYKRGIDFKPDITVFSSS